jgi:excisionase family DNA binding protein
MSEQLTVPEAAERLGLSPYTIYSWIQRRRIAYVKLGRSVRISSSEVRRLIRQGTVKAETKEETIAEVA